MLRHCCSGIYFNNFQCFCFTQERLDPHQKVDMPVVFYVDPAFGNDPDMQRHRAADARLYLLPLGRSTECQGPLTLSHDPIHPTPSKGKDLFNEQCAACHALDINKIGPKTWRRVRPARRRGARLRILSRHQERRPDLVGGQSRTAGSPSPSKLIPGAKMPVSVPDPIAPPRDIIAYLQQESERGGGGLRGKTTAHDTGY